ncbi:MAG: hypothetical protein K2N32_01100 [Clostridia bacterium]|nr:hypothetical protein [Clostridia bacterium]
MSKKKEEKKGMNNANGPMPNMQGPGASFGNDPRSPFYNVYGPGAQNNQSNSFYNNYGRPNQQGSPAAAPNNNVNNNQNNNLMNQLDDDGKKAKKPMKFVVPPDGKMSKKDKKVYKKYKKFDDYDLRNYPMTAGKWIGTFIIMAIPLINIIAGLCWLFGVGNKSRSAFVRAHLIIFLIILLLIGIGLGVGWKIMKDKASEQVGAETNGEVIYYIVDSALTMVEPVMGKDAADAYRVKIAEKLGVKGPDINQGGEEGEYNPDDDFNGSDEDFGSADDGIEQTA